MSNSHISEDNNLDVVEEIVQSEEGEEIEEEENGESFTNFKRENKEGCWDLCICIFTLGAYPKRKKNFENIVNIGIRKQRLYEKKTRICCLTVFLLLLSNVFFILVIFRLKDLVQENNKL